MSVEYPTKLDDGFYHVFVGEEEVGKYKTLKKAIEKSESVPKSHVLMEDGTLVYPEAKEDETTETTDQADVEIVEPAEAPKTVTFYGIVQTRLNVRKSPSMDADIVTTLKKGTMVDIYENLGEWYGIPSADGESFIKASYVKAGKSKHTVVEGDTFADLAKAGGCTEKAIKELNSITTNRLRIGQEIILP